MASTLIPSATHPLAPTPGMGADRLDPSAQTYAEPTTTSHPSGIVSGTTGSSTLTVEQLPVLVSEPGSNLPVTTADSPASASSSAPWPVLVSGLDNNIDVEAQVPKVSSSSTVNPPMYPPVLESQSGPIRSTGTHEQSQDRPIVTGYRLLNLSVIVGYGSAKAIITPHGSKFTISTLEWVFGIIVAAFLICLGWYENVRKFGSLGRLLFETDYTSTIVQMMKYGLLILLFLFFPGFILFLQGDPWKWENLGYSILASVVWWMLMACSLACLSRSKPRSKYHYFRR